MFSSRSWSPLVMNRFTPVRCQLPSGWRTALVRPAPTSDPAPDSVSTIVEAQPRSAQSCAQRRCSSVPSSWTTRADIVPEEYRCTAGLEPSTSSAIAQRSVGGSGRPPSAAERSIACQPPSR